MTVRRWLSLAQLLRLPNVFTAVADVLLGFLVTHPSWQPWEQLALVVGSSTGLYLAGMVLNDWWDRATDAVERPQRPIPSGRVPAGAALALGSGLLASGVGLGWAAAAASRQVWPGGVATLLAAVVLLYNGVLKHTLLGPLAMGGCRGLNVLLGMSAATTHWQAWQLVLAGGLGLYIVGVSWFARSEAGRSGRVQLALGLAVMLGGVAVVAWYPSWATGREFPQIEPDGRWGLFWLLIAAAVSWRCLRAIADPRPVLVQAAVKNCLLSLIIFDAAAATAVHPAETVLWILALLLPAMFLGRWVYST